MLTRLTYWSSSTAAQKTFGPPDWLCSRCGPSPPACRSRSASGWFPGTQWSLLNRIVRPCLIASSGHVCTADHATNPFCALRENMRGTDAPNPFCALRENKRGTAYGEHTLQHVESIQCCRWRAYSAVNGQHTVMPVEHIVLCEACMWRP